MSTSRWTTDTMTSAWDVERSDPNDELFADIVEDDSTIPDSGVVLAGEPYDGAVIGRTGAREGPGAIRQELASLKANALGHDGFPSITDIGDLSIEGDETRAVQQTVSGQAAKVHGPERFPVFLGGDNSLSFANARPLLDAGRDGDVAVVSLDAHLDCREVEWEPTSGTPYRQLFGAGLGTLVVAGARDFETSAVYEEFLRDQGGHTVSSERFRDPEAVVADIRDHTTGYDTVYLSLDMDVIDAAAAPGVSAPTPGGPSPREVFAVIRRLTADDRVTGFEVVECAPPLDRGDLTVKAAARAVAHAIAGYARR